MMAGVQKMKFPVLASSLFIVTAVAWSSGHRDVMIDRLTEG